MSEAPAAGPGAMRRALAVGLVLLLAGCENFSRLEARFGRDAWQRPELVIELLAITPGATVADLGAGDGYFVPHLAAAVGEAGSVYAVEVDDELVGALREEFAGRPNVRVVRGALEDPGLPDGAIDLVLVVNVYHHIDDQIAYFRRLRTDLAPAGRVVMVELNPAVGGVLGIFAPEGHATPRDELVAAMIDAGYRHAASHDVLPIQNFEVFTPLGTSPDATTHSSSAPPPPKVSP